MTQHQTIPTAIDERDAAPYIGYTPAALRAWRHQGKGPTYIRINRSIRYRVTDLDAFLDRHRIDARGSALTDRMVTANR